MCPGLSGGDAWLPTGAWCKSPSLSSPHDDGGQGTGYHLSSADSPHVLHHWLVGQFYGPHTILWGYWSLDLCRVVLSVLRMWASVPGSAHLTPNASSI